MSRSHSEFPQNAGAPADLLKRRQHAQSDVKGTEPLHITAYIYVVVNAIRTPFQGAFLVRVVPRAEAWLKPWAVFCSPVGRLELAQENVQTPVQALRAWLLSCCPSETKPSLQTHCGMSVRDKSHSPIEAPHDYLSAYEGLPSVEWH